MDMSAENKKIVAQKKFQFCSGGYAGLNPNFILFAIEQREEIPEDFSCCLKVLKNILFRGNPVNLSKNLKSELSKYFGNDQLFDNFDRSIKYSFDMQKRMDWIGLIKGGDNKNPALDFYEMMQENLPQYANLFLPECYFFRFINSSSINQACAVDFYNPFFKLVIEIDGSQHRESVQKLNDKERDRILRENNVDCFRIPTDTNFNEKISELKSILESKDYPFVQNKDISKIEKTLTFIFRFQIALLEAYEKGFFIFDDIFLKIDEDIDKKVFEIALDDLIIWLQNLLNIANSQIVLKKHNIIITDEFKEQNAINIDISISKLYDYTDIRHNKDVVCVRNDFFKYSGDTKIDFSSEKNYFKLSCSDFRFDNVTPEKHHNELLFFLENFFGFKEFRPKQEEIICQGLAPQNGVIGLLPTGSGKSLCFQYVGLLTPGVSLIVEPLISLMEDQCSNLIERHRITNTGLIRSSKDDPLLGKAAFDRLKDLNIKFLYISPERFLNKEFEELIQTLIECIGQIVIDEVHTLSEWGHQFRTSYLLLFNDLFELGFGKTRCLLMGTSGTASTRVTQDIATEFKKVNKKARLIKSDSVKRPELSYSVIACSDDEEKKNKVYQLILDKAKNNEKSLVFAPYTSDAKTLDKLIKDKKSYMIKSDYFIGEKKDSSNNAPASKSNREKIESFKKGNINVICATKAFGMGLDIPDIRQTIHFGISDSVEAIYQEMGRAGRDAKPSKCYVVYFKDKANLDSILNTFKNNFVALADDCDSYSKMLRHVRKPIIEDGRQKWITPTPQCLYGETYKQITLMASSNSDVNFETEFLSYIWEFISRNRQEEFYLTEAFNFLQEKMRGFGFSQKFYKRQKNGDNWEDVPNLNSFGNMFEKGLYKLYCLRLLKLWKMNYMSSIDNPMFTNITILPIDDFELKENLLNHILRYDSTFKVKDYEPEPKKNIFKNLCVWYFNTYFENRWNSLKNLYDMVTTFSSSEVFEERIESYFKTNNQLDMSIIDISNYQQWFDVINSDTLTSLKDQIANKLTEFPNNLSVNFISGIVYLKIDDFDNSYGREKLKNAFQVIDEKLERDLPEILNLSFENLSISERKVFIRFLFEFFPHYFNNSHLIDVMEKFEPNVKLKFDDRSDLLKEVNILTSFRNQISKLLINQ